MEYEHGDRVVHPTYAFGAVLAKREEAGAALLLVHLDNGDDVEAPAQEWEPAFVNSSPVIPLAQMSDEQLDAELERFRTMRQIGTRKRTTRAAASREPSDVAKMNQMLEDAAGDPELQALLTKLGVKL